jgi:hypothetical protein
MFKKKNKNKIQRMCQKCGTEPVSHVRKFVLKNVPKEYFLEMDDICAMHIINNMGHSYTDKIHFINLPPEKILTKYDYYACEKCYLMEKVQTEMWNTWERYNQSVLKKLIS